MFSYFDSLILICHRPVEGQAQVIHQYHTWANLLLSTFYRALDLNALEYLDLPYYASCIRSDDLTSMQMHMYLKVLHR